MPHPSHSEYSQTTPGTSLDADSVQQTTAGTTNAQGTARASAGTTAFRFSGGSTTGLTSINMNEAVNGKVACKAYIESTQTNTDARMLGGNGNWYVGLDDSQQRFWLRWNGGNDTYSADSSVLYDQVIDLEVEWTTWAGNAQTITVKQNGVTVITLNYSGVSFNPSQDLMVGGISSANKSPNGWFYDIEVYNTDPAVRTSYYPLTTEESGSSPYTITDEEGSNDATLTDAAGSWQVIPGT